MQNYNSLHSIKQLQLYNYNHTMTCYKNNNGTITITISILLQLHNSKTIAQIYLTIKRTQITKIIMAQWQVHN